ncbi:MAG: F-type H+-transporting ATPase subunit a [Thermoleophilaceae bacterium]|jgi:F-type H+-transporting ATPase subunit a|nr:F-type H+-transporting ATPase subunit a [Thermoleophilaceae bacterium]MEA2405986.1 F-type H+-transporting ATPase subunit a [Thermoleophilaceae bacterium]
MSRKQKVWLGVFLWFGIAIALYAIFGSDGKNEAFKPQDEFKLEPWVNLHVAGIDMSINKAVLYVFLACVLTAGTMIFIARRMQEHPNRVQTLVEGAYDLTYTQIAKGNMPTKTAAKYFPFVATLFFFIWFSNMLGYIPLPTNTHETVGIFGLDFPAFALYAATANLSVPLVLTLVVWGGYQIEGVRQHGLIGHLKGWLPAGVSGVAAGPIFFIEFISQFMRIISLSVRLFANILAGHLLILFMGGGLAVLLGLAVLGWITLPIAIVFFILEVGLIATLQAFIFATLTSIYFGEASAGGH